MGEKPLTTRLLSVALDVVEGEMHEHRNVDGAACAVENLAEHDGRLAPGPAVPRNENENEERAMYSHLERRWRVPSAET